MFEDKFFKGILQVQMASKSSSSGRFCSAGATDMGLILRQGIPWKRAWQPTPEFLPGESHGHRRTMLQSMGLPKVTDWAAPTHMQWSSNPVSLGPYEEDIRTQTHLEGHVKTVEGRQLNYP